MASKMPRPLVSNPAILEELAYDSFVLLDLHRAFEAVWGEDQQVVNFFEERRTRIWKVWFWQWDEFVSMSL